MLLLLVMVALLLAGTLRIGLLTDGYARVTLPIDGIEQAGFFKRLWHELLMWWHSM